MRRPLIIGLTAGLLFGGWLPAGADQIEFGGLGQAAQEMALDLGPRAVARAGALVAEARGLDAMNWNPAGLAASSRYHLEGMHAVYVQDTTLETLAYAQPAWKNGGIGFQAAYVNYGSMEQVELVNGLPATVGSFQPGTLLLALGAGHRILDTVSVGVVGKYYRYEMMGQGYTAWAGDLGLQWRSRDTYAVGLAIRNLGTPVGGYALPMTFKLGAAYRLPVQLAAHDRWSVEADADVNPSMAWPVLRAGMAYQAEVFALRAGYLYRHGTELAGPAGLSLGAGLRGAMTYVDYAVVFYGLLGTVHHVGFGVMF